MTRTEEKIQEKVIDATHTTSCIDGAETEKEEVVVSFKRRENVSLMKCPAGLRNVANKKRMEMCAKAMIPVTPFIAKEDCMKCPNGTKNREKIFKTKNVVLIVNTFNDDLSEQNESRSYSSADVWMLVVDTKKMWKRPLNTVIGKLTPSKKEAIMATVSMAGNVGEVAKRASEKVKQVECFYVTFDGFDKKDGIWFESGLFNKDACGNYVMDSTRLEFSPFEEKEVTPGPEDTFRAS